MRKEQEIFTQVNAQNTPVSADILDTLEQEVMNESVIREYIRELIEVTEHDDKFKEDATREDKMKVAQLFWSAGAGMGIQMAEMTPGLEDLATEFEEFRVLVEEFVDLSDRFTAQGPTNMPLNSGDLYRAGENIKKAAMKLTSHPWQADKEVAHAATSWKNMFGKAMTWVRWSGTSNTRAFSASQDDYEALKDWVVV